MGGFEDLLGGFASAVSPINLLWALVGVTLGTAVGVLPGIGPALTVALLLPLTFELEASSALILFAGTLHAVTLSTESLALSDGEGGSARRSSRW